MATASRLHHNKSAFIWSIHFCLGFDCLRSATPLVNYFRGLRPFTLKNSFAGFGLVACSCYYCSPKCALFLSLLLAVFRLFTGSLQTCFSSAICCHLCRHFLFKNFFIEKNNWKDYLKNNYNRSEDYFKQIKKLLIQTLFENCFKKIV